MSEVIPRHSTDDYGPTYVGSPLFGQSLVRGWFDNALLMSEPHWVLPSGKWSGGGPFCCWKEDVVHLGTQQTSIRYDGFEYGPFTSLGATEVPAYRTHFTAPPDPHALGVDLLSSGAFATGYARAKPGNPVAGLGQFLVELRDLPAIPGGEARRRWRNQGLTLSQLPGFLRSRLKDFRDLGSEYLNVVFGWKPFVGDLQKLYGLWKTIDRRLADIVRNNGKSVRRRADVEDSSTVDATESVYPYPYAGVWSGIPNWIPGISVRTVTRKRTTRVWFAGSFRYYIPDIGSSQWTARATAALFGANPTPQLLWEVMPWSWLVDYFTNVGDVISNASSNAVDNLTLEYGFLMKHTTERLEVGIQTYHEAVDLPRSWKWPKKDCTYTSWQTTETKLRATGDAGFSLLWGAGSNGLSPYKLGVLAALGASRTPHTRYSRGLR